MFDNKVLASITLSIMLLSGFSYANDCKYSNYTLAYPHDHEPICLIEQVKLVDGLDLFFKLPDGLNNKCGDTIDCMNRASFAVWTYLNKIAAQFNSECGLRRHDTEECVEVIERHPHIMMWNHVVNQTYIYLGYYFETRMKQTLMGANFFTKRQFKYISKTLGEILAHYSVSGIVKTRDSVYEVEIFNDFCSIVQKVQVTRYHGIWRLLHLSNPTNIGIDCGHCVDRNLDRVCLNTDETQIYTGNGIRYEDSVDNNAPECRIVDLADIEVSCSDH